MAFSYPIPAALRSLRCPLGRRERYLCREELVGLNLYAVAILFAAPAPTVGMQHVETQLHRE